MNTTQLIEDQPLLTREGKRGVLRNGVRFVVHLGVLLIAAGTVNWFQAWLYAGLNLCLTAIYTIVLLRHNPRLLNARADMPKDTQRFDKTFVIGYTLLTFTTLIVAGLDVKRYQWTAIPPGGVLTGVILAIGAFLFALWAMAANTHFETTVRLQRERDHRVFSGGPYRIVRHPGNAGMIGLSLSYPLILGSWWAFIPATTMALAVVLRTYCEDRFLQHNLSGYTAYTHATRYRLCPYVW